MYIMILDELKNKAALLPMSPGVYIMKNEEDRVIYVGKAKKLKNRVSQYFQDTTSHSAKTALMVSKIHHFDVIVAASEFEALVLECSLIKRYQPKYNILLKDDKGFPYIRLDMKQQYPQLSMVSKIADDGANYYGPFGSRGITQNILDTIRVALKLPNCNKSFPRDIGKGRPCLHYHMNQCSGWCQKNNSQEEYRAVTEQVRHLLQGNYKLVSEQIKQEMLEAAETLNFELAASLRDRLSAVESLSNKQLVTAGAMADTDVIGFAQTETKACFSVLHFSGGNLLDKDYELLTVQEDPTYAVSALMKQYYLSRGFAPKVILLPFTIDDSSLFEQLLQEKYNKTTRIRIPQRGDNLRLVEMAVNNASQEAERATDKEERVNVTLTTLEKMLGISSLKRIESFDVSNISGTDIVAGMVVFVDGQPRRSAYRHFKINGLDSQNDYASMYQILNRRLKHYLQGDDGFDATPDLLLIDGGASHAKVAQDAQRDLGLNFPIFGMVKDDKHRTRALITAEGREIAIDTKPSVFSFIGKIQEETHRFAISYHRKLRSKRMRYSALDAIPGIGPKRKEDLLKAFKSLKGIRAASLKDLEQYLPKDIAAIVYEHFRNDTEG